jgi:hypothetical protein
MRKKEDEETAEWIAERKKEQMEKNIHRGMAARRAIIAA